MNSVNESGLPPALRSGSPALFKRTIALSLKKWRLEAKLPQKDAAKRLDRTVQHISNLEAGQLPTAADLELLLGLYGKADRIPFMRELLSAARKAKNWWTALSGVTPKWFDLYLGLESGATELSLYNSVVLPGLLQTREYATAVLRGNTDLGEEQVEQGVELRLGRQQILDRAHEPVHLWTVLDESVLYRQRGDAKTMRDQLKHLLEMSKRPRIDIQVLPFDAGSTPAQDGGNFVVMKFPPEMEGDPGLVYVELLTGGQYFEKPDEIAEYRRALTRLHALAADQKVTRGIIERAMKEVK
ncbi:helix-turn-helix domain-containing protein [Actinophytocola algeriensis]|uniref:Transcriptional regulator with XRE-family HTH domain n=1 Tax=Actinophytocola algeriensis TaxID=1768010 RepID=A0A7W7Q230_9PSEU|nr:helix-turn-helix transcriptional regulator [Actinophytocola algeriensis]MBB4905600.1 transcriptional regulator with XRE-family HTH domain [Actinophytocola algeriensis]MBE1472715.1 transcriptional regulator with XRE-family HTH domain [Actinophytocola algeriensis]